jgi:nucleoside triphosphate diphosphatase
MTENRRYGVEDLLTLMSRLRDPKDGCPWDQEQSYRTIAPSTIEEAYEVVDAIERGNYDHLREELGDLLFQVIFYSQLAQEEQRFGFADIVSELVTKLVRRHPHVFPDNTLESRAGDVAPDGTGESDAAIKARWEALKKEERAAKGQQGVLDDVPLNLPALTRAAKLQKRASQVGFDWPDISGVLDKIEEEVEELRQAIKESDSAAIKDEMGDLLFALVNCCRHLKVEPESSLRGTNSKFERRFHFIESSLQDLGLTPDDASLEQMDALWDQAKIAGL